jgi:hypothetical protein
VLMWTDHLAKYKEERQKEKEKIFFKEEAEK